MTWEALLERLRARPWRLILDPPRPGAENMARDLDLLLTAESPVLRLYAWARPCVSLGYAQRWEPPDLPGVEVVRRPTGGRALLHLPSEITYAVVLPEAGPSVRSVFCGLAASLARALLALGVPVEVSAGGEVAPGNPSCLAAAAAGEVTAGGRKLVGSAQVRRQGRLLQHGALPRRSDPALLAAAIPGALPEADLASLGFADLAPEDLARAWGQALGVRWASEGKGKR